MTKMKQSSISPNTWANNTSSFSTGQHLIYSVFKKVVQNKSLTPFKCSEPHLMVLHILKKLSRLYFSTQLFSQLAHYFPETKHRRILKHTLPYPPDTATNKLRAVWWIRERVILITQRV